MLLNFLAARFFMLIDHNDRQRLKRTGTFFQLLIFIWVQSNALNAQEDSISAAAAGVQVSCFADAYYVYDLNQPSGLKRQTFLYNHNRHNRPAINLAFLKVKIERDQWRGNLALQAGTYVNDNYEKERPVFRHFLEANFGLSLNKKKNCWLDAGILPSHIGFESAVSSENWTMTRSLLAENSPYFLTGLRVSYVPTAEWFFAALVTTGWQRIQPLSGNTLPGFGTQISRKIGNRGLLNWSTFLGTDDPDANRRMRYFSNLYAQLIVSQGLGLIAGIDFGTQQLVRHSKFYSNWWSPVLIFRYSFSELFQVAVRAEYYQDPDKVIIDLAKGLESAGFSITADYQIRPAFLIRAETRLLQSKESVFKSKGGLSAQNTILAFSVCFKLAKHLKTN